MLEFISCSPGLNGFDDSSVADRWQMVPLNGERLVALINGHNASVELNDSYAVTKTEIYTNNALNVTSEQQKWANTVKTIANDKGWKTARFFLLKGINEGTTILTASSTMLRRLEISVHSQRNLYITFHIVTDKNGKKCSVRSEAEVTSMLADLNSFFPEQTNLKFTCHNIKRVTLNHEVGDSILYKYKNKTPDVTVKGDETKYIFENADTGASINVFFVWDISAQGVGSAPKGTSFDPRDPLGLTYGRCILIEDKVKQNAGLVLGHEIIHSLGYSGHHALDGGLMHLFSEKMGPRIYSKEAITAYNDSFC